ncbi:hypothetical protein [Halomarina pelagica]|uniref:hypothetical protein n=1 Tax=Halomarina pelagica TaxID=2961599 RepID=UPI0020C405AD|nr:hypothetical protein [Halomarina sp. BND7]
MVIQFVLFSLYVVSIYLYGRQQFTGQVGMLAGATTLPLILGQFHTSLHPSIHSFYLLPLFFLSVHYKSYRWRIVMLLLLFAIVFFHPMTAILALCYIAVSAAVPWIGMLFDETWKRTSPTITIKPGVVMVSIGALLIYWYIGFNRITVLVAGWIVGVSSLSGGNGNSAAFALSPFHFFLRGFTLYGDVVLYMFISIFAAFIVTFLLWRHPDVTGRYLHVEVQWFFGLVFCLGVVALGILGNPIRAARYFFLFSAVLIGGAMAALTRLGNYLFPSRHQRTLNTICSILLAANIVLAGVVGAAGVYPNGNHLTETEVKSVNWILTHTNNDPVLSLSMSRKMTLFVRGTHDAPKQWRFQEEKAALQLPSHLGYQNNQTVANLHKDDFYIFTKEYDLEYYKSSYREQWPALTWYTVHDLRKLRNDSAADRIYTSGLKRASVWRVTQRDTA